jgi:hypothetical protein
VQKDKQQGLPSSVDDYSSDVATGTHVGETVVDLIK